MGMGLGNTGYAPEKKPMIGIIFDHPARCIIDGTWAYKYGRIRKVNTTNGSKVLTATDTTFLTDISPGYEIVVGYQTPATIERRTVDTVDSNTQLTVTENFTITRTNYGYMYIIDPLFPAGGFQEILGTNKFTVSLFDNNLLDNIWLLNMTVAEMLALQSNGNEIACHVPDGLGWTGQTEKTQSEAEAYLAAKLAFYATGGFYPQNIVWYGTQTNHLEWQAAARVYFRSGGGGGAEASTNPIKQYAYYRLSTDLTTYNQWKALADGVKAGTNFKCIYIHPSYTQWHDGVKRLADGTVDAGGKYHWEWLQDLVAYCASIGVDIGTIDEWVNRNIGVMED